ncbi:hypothetical protein L484_015655 [Morus notabilis]|uniref:Uncharacterized protein n=1 Tax=Morus notabilis TaxID=981085 RepID=W9QYH1_9ROSA|nr:hypothetical protein L484_015655 [Morus notabilis]
MLMTWKEAAKKCRGKEHGSFIEWMGKLEESEELEKRLLFEMLRTLLIDAGILISSCLIDYLLITLLSADREEMAANLCEVESMIGCLSVEENLIVINTFISMVKLLKRMTSMATKPKTKTDMIKKRDLQIEEENKVHLIIIEVLRLEVAFCYPDLPMTVSNEVCVAMGDHLTVHVMKGKLDILSDETDMLTESELRSDGDNDSARKSFEQVLTVGIQEIWNQLDLKPRT